MDAVVIALDHPAAFDPQLVGRKAADLARARAAGLPVGPGVVLTTNWSRHDTATATAVWRIISHDGDRPLVVRPSSTVFGGTGDQAPAATEARDLATFLDAVADVREPGDAPVLVHPHVGAAWQGSYHADDVAGRRPRPLVSAWPGGDLETSPATWVVELDHLGRVSSVLSGRHLAHPPGEVLVRLVRLAGRVDERLGGLHDLEWAADADGALHLLRVRPVAGAAAIRCAA